MQNESTDDENYSADEASNSFHANNAYGSGTIEKIELINFMCHSHLEMELSSHLNFISGQNGSGKSAILVAIVTCLGAPARFSNRGSKIGDLVKTGKNNAIIRITLRNEGIESFKSSLYGSSITIERRISRKGTSSYRFFNKNGEECSSNRNELIEMMEQFNIQVENPCSILMQEMAKTFLNSNKPEKKYELFLKATQLEKMNYDLQKAINFNHELEETLSIKERALPELVDEIHNLEEELKVIQQLNRQRGDLRNMRNNLAWAYIQQQEDELSNLGSDLSRVISNQEHIKKKIEDPQIQLEDLKVKRADKQNEVGKIKEMVMDFMEKKTHLESKSNDLSIKISVYEEDMKSCENEIQRYKNREERIINELEELRGFTSHNREMEQNLRQSQIQKCEAQLRILNDERLNELSFINALDTKIATFGEEMFNTSRTLDEIRREFSNAHEKLNNLKNRSNNSLLAFGRHTAQIVEIIEKHSHSFKVKPLGPIGFYIKLDNIRWTKAVDVACGNVLDAFVVDQKADAIVLRELCARYNSRVPQIILTSINVKKHHIDSKYLPDSSFQTVMNVLNIWSDVVFNILVDRCNMESIILLKDDNEAEEVIFNSRSRENPPNVKMAITSEGSIYTWRAGSQLLFSARDKAPRLTADLSEDIKKSEIRLTKLKSHMDSVSNKLENIKREHQDATREREKLTAQQKKRDLHILKLDDEIRESRESVTVPTNTHSINELEENMEKLRIQREEMAKHMLDLQEGRRKHLEELKSIKDEIQSNYLSIEQLSETVNNVMQELDQINAMITRQAERIAKYQVAIEKLSLVITEQQQIVSEKQNMIQCDVEKALQLCPRPTERIEEAPDVISRQIDIIERMIDERQKSQRLSDEVVGKYRKAKADYKELKMLIEKMHAINKKMQKMVTVRFRTWKLFKKFIGQRIRALFIGYLSQRGFTGSLKFDHEQATLNIYINPEIKDHSKGELRSTTTLSGGEKSYSTVSFLLALWDCTESPFLAMDEFDVFMDPVNRQISIELLIKATKDKPYRQHIFLTPHELSSITPDGEHIKILRMKPPERIK